MEKRGDDFPIIALFPASVDVTLIPAGIKTRLFVSITDPDWKERIIAAMQKRSPSITKNLMEPYAITVHQYGEQHVFEVRPRGGTWSPFLAAIPISEKDIVMPHLGFGASKRIP